MATPIDDLRQQMHGIPWMVREAILGNVVVGNWSGDHALVIARALKYRYTGVQLRLSLNRD